MTVVFTFFKPPFILGAGKGKAPKKGSNNQPAAVAASSTAAARKEAVTNQSDAPPKVSDDAAISDPAKQPPQVPPQEPQQQQQQQTPKRRRKAFQESDTPGEKPQQPQQQPSQQSPLFGHHASSAAGSATRRPAAGPSPLRNAVSVRRLDASFVSEDDGKRPPSSTTSPGSAARAEEVDAIVEVDDATVRPAPPPSTTSSHRRIDAAALGISISKETGEKEGFLKSNHNNNNSNSKSGSASPLSRNTVRPVHEEIEEVDEGWVEDDMYRMLPSLDDGSGGPIGRCVGTVNVVFRCCCHVTSTALITTFVFTGDGAPTLPRLPTAPCQSRRASW